MNWDRIEGNCSSGGHLTDDQLDVIAGKRDKLIGKVREAYGLSKNEAERQVTDWERRRPEDMPHSPSTGGVTPATALETRALDGAVAFYAKRSRSWPSQR